MTLPPVLNAPAVVAAAGAGSLAAFPALERIVVDKGALSWTAIRAMNVVTYLLNVYAVTVPGRIDGESAENLAENKSVDDSNSPSLLTPAGWAFGIWAAIFAGELVFTVSQFLVPESAHVASVIRKASVPFSMAQVFQTLWCASFRPRYEGGLIYISSALLASAAFGLSKANAAYSLCSPKAYSNLQYCLFFLPISLHFGWGTAAALVSLNSSVARQESSSSRGLAILGHASAVAATAAGVFVTVTRNAPVYGGVISWALFAVADAMKKRLTVPEHDGGEKKSGIYGVATQKRLSWLGGWISAGASVLVAYSLSALASNDGQLSVAP